MSFPAFSLSLKRGPPFGQRRACSPRAPRRRPADIQAHLCSLPRRQEEGTPAGLHGHWQSGQAWEVTEGSSEPPGDRHGEWMLFAGGQNRSFFSGHRSPGSAIRCAISGDTAGSPQTRRWQQIPSSVWGMPLGCSKKMKSKTKPTTHTRTPIPVKAVDKS